MTFVNRRTVSALLAVTVAVGCQVIVSSDVPDYKCTGASASSCPSGMVCDQASGLCVSDAGAPVEDAGDEPVEDAADAAVDSDAGGALALGEACRVDSECETRLCGTSTMLTTIFTQGTGPVCTKTCCVSSDCPSGFVCFNGGTGGTYCVDAAKAQRPAPATGGKPAGSICGVASECRSGLCTNGRCIDTCCLATDCAAGTTCRVSTVSAPPPAHDIWVCAPSPPGATKNAGEGCVLVDDCKNDNCVGSGDAGLNPRVCRPSCCKKADCAAQMPSFPNAQCTYSTSGTDQLKWCATATGVAKNNAACGTSTQCESGYCDAELQKCLSICCDDSDCATNEACRPSGVSTPFLRCVPAR